MSVIGRSRKGLKGKRPDPSSKKTSGEKEEDLMGNDRVTCTYCEDYDPESPWQDRPWCIGLRCHGFLQGCACQDCIARQVEERRHLWAVSQAAEGRKDK